MTRSRFATLAGLAAAVTLAAMPLGVSSVEDAQPETRPRRTPVNRTPHQGKREQERRLRQLAKREANPMSDIGQQEKGAEK